MCIHPIRAHAMFNIFQTLEDTAVQNYNRPIKWHSMCTKDNFVLIYKPFTCISLVAPRHNPKS